MSTVQLLVIVLILFVGIGLGLVISRRRAGTLEPPSPPPTTTGRTIREPKPSVPVDEPDTDSTAGSAVGTAAEAAVVAEAEAITETAAASVSEIAPVVEPEPRVIERPRFRDRLSKARNALSGYVGSIGGRSKIDAETWDELEEALILADVGMNATQELLDHLRSQVKAQGLSTGEQLLDALKAELTVRLTGFDRDLHFSAGEGPTVWLFVGVNGVGKTTTIGKLGAREVAAGHRVVMAAGDTFRAAAAEQLGMWAERAGAELVRGNEGGDPSSVIFDGVAAAAARGADLVLGDTAGRLHTKVNLMDELRKVRRVADQGAGTVTEVLLVLDATTGQNGLVQAQQFTEAVELTGVVLTKLDGSAKGGIVIAIHEQLGIPVKAVGLGEGIDDLVPFDAAEFVDALFS
jgi:fused signal recognition particle receptor